MTKNDAPRDHGQNNDPDETLATVANTAGELSYGQAQLVKGIDAALGPDTILRFSNRATAQKLLESRAVRDVSSFGVYEDAGGRFATQVLVVRDGLNAQDAHVTKLQIIEISKGGHTAFEYPKSPEYGADTKTIRGELVLTADFNPTTQTITGWTQVDAEHVHEGHNMSARLEGQGERMRALDSRAAAIDSRR